MWDPVMWLWVVVATLQPCATPFFVLVDFNTVLCYAVLDGGRSLGHRRKPCLASTGANNGDFFGHRSPCWRHYGDLDLVFLGENLVPQMGDNDT